MFSSGSNEAWLTNLREQLAPYDVTPEPARVEAIVAVSDGLRIDYRPMGGGVSDSKALTSV